VGKPEFAERAHVPRLRWVPRLGSCRSVRTASWDAMPTARASLPTVAAVVAAAAVAAAYAEAAAAAAEAVPAHPGWGKQGAATAACRHRRHRRHCRVRPPPLLTLTAAVSDATIRRDTAVRRHHASFTAGARPLPRPQRPRGRHHRPPPPRLSPTAAIGCGSDLPRRPSLRRPWPSRPRGVPRPLLQSPSAAAAAAVSKASSRR